MKQHLYTKLLILYFMLGGICFLLLSSGGSYLVEKRLERSTGESLYRTANQLVSKNELRQAVKSPKNESLTLALSSAAAFQNADFWVMDTDGNVLINTNQQSSDSGDITVRNFRPEDYEDTCYSSGTFYGTLKTTQLSTVVPIKDTDLVTGYLVIHYPMKNLYESRSNIVEVMVLIFIVIYALFFSFLLIYFYRVHKPLKEILKGALEFANGNLTYTIPVDSEDEMGYLSHSLNYMADKLNKNGEYQRQFISNVSHDFRSPLTSIKGYVEAMLDGTIPPEMQERYLKVIAFESTRLEKLTRSLLTLNELDVKKRMMHMRRFDINETIRTTAATFEGTCSERNIRLELLLAGKELFVRADMEQERAVELDDDRVDRQDHERQIVIHHAEYDCALRVDHLEELHVRPGHAVIQRDQSDLLEQLIEQAVVLQNRHPRIGAQQEVHPHREHDEHHRHALEGLTLAAHPVRHRIADQQANGRRDQRELERAEKHIRILAHVHEILEREAAVGGGEGVYHDDDDGRHHEDGHPHLIRHGEPGELILHPRSPPRPPKWRPPALRIPRNRSCSHRTCRSIRSFS